MFKVLILPVIGIVLVLQFRSQSLIDDTQSKESKTYNVVERESSFYIDTNGIENEYINSNQIINKYEY
ncbi:hypothetical protein UFOVP622_40 [uncultured Caudovirales phage]|uniref:Uncharacterized protein n=1 Tax=uncultured Caudovirales phage TaxID=2100421 RepID=A0A6J5N3X0_9CAUD|nr:hypothetical protein UFOVP622_40 [uncultured Caudovirales phage]